MKKVLKVANILSLIAMMSSTLYAISYSEVQTTTPSEIVTLPSDSIPSFSSVTTSGAILTSPMLVIAPTQVKLVIDPYNMNQKGQVYSSDIVFENTGLVPVQLKLKSCIITLDSSSEVDLTDEILTYEDEQKKVVLALQEKENLEKAALSNGDIDEELGIIYPGEKKVFQIVGAVTTGSVWTKEDNMKVNLNFHLESMVSLQNLRY